jgi:formate/nitrite transporter FocA (FNT family)
MGHGPKVEFEHMEPMLLSSLCFSKEICHLQFGRHILKSNRVLVTVRLSEGSINTNMLCKFMLHRVFSNLYGSSIIT